MSDHADAMKAYSVADIKKYMGWLEAPICDSNGPLNGLDGAIVGHLDRLERENATLREAQAQVFKIAMDCINGRISDVEALQLLEAQAPLSQDTASEDHADNERQRAEEGMADQRRGFYP